MNDKIKIKLQIADSYYPVTIDREDEEMVRSAAKQVNIKLNTYRSHYKGLEPEKLLAMIAYDFSLEVLKLKGKNDTEPYSRKIEELTEFLEEYFRKA
ncbi:cell division protein ZapA [Bacteroides sp. OttesenSCG-928-F21]|nr:cell division protein ZapA [Bacteroides sp. OttesenSCG-928-F21]